MQGRARVIVPAQRNRDIRREKTGLFPPKLPTYITTGIMVQKGQLYLWLIFDINYAKSLRSKRGVAFLLARAREEEA